MQLTCRREDDKEVHYNVEALFRLVVPLSHSDIVADHCEKKANRQAKGPLVHLLSRIESVVEG